MIYTGYRNPLYDGTTAAINPAPPYRDQPIIPAADGHTKLTMPLHIRCDRVLGWCVS